MTRVDVKRAGVRLPSAGYGCARPLAGFGCICILLGSLAISRWDDLYTIVRVGAIVLVVFGVICVMPMLGLWTLRLWVDRFTKKVFHHLNHMNEDETLRNRARYADDLEYRPATDTDLPEPDRELYDRTTTEMVGIGWRLLGDVVNGKADGAPVVLRTAASADGKSWMMIYREPSASVGSQDLTIDIASEFLDGTFCCTSNSPAISLRTLPPQLRMNSYPPEMGSVDLVGRHDASLAMLTSSEPLQFVTLADVLASQQRKYALAAGFKAMIASNDVQ